MWMAAKLARYERRAQPIVQGDVRTPRPLTPVRLDKSEINAYDAYFLDFAFNLRSPLLTLDIGMQRVAREIGITILE